MVVGILSLTLGIPDAYSLKEKRTVVRSLVEKTRNRFNAAVAEVGENEMYNRAQIGICVVANDHSFANSMLDKIIDAIEDMAIGRAEILDTSLEIMTVS